MSTLNNNTKQIFAVLFFSVLAATNVAWVPANASVKNTSRQFKDTIPGKKHDKNYYQGEAKDLDQRIEQLEKGLDKLDRQLQEKDFKIMEQRLEESLSKIDGPAIQRKVEEAMSKVDFNKIQLEAAEVMKKIDMQKIKQQIREAMKEVQDKSDMKQLQHDLNEGMKEVQKSIQEAGKIDYKKIEKELEKNRLQWEKQKITIDKELQEAKKELNSNKGKIDKELANAREQIQNTKEELQAYKKMITSMDKEGLLNSREDYTIDYQEGTLLINGKKQSAQVFDSYKTYFKKDNVHIKYEKGNFNINSDN